MTTKTLIRGGTVVSMDPQIGDLTGDVLVEDDKIVAVEPNISADAEVIDASDSIVIPGFVDTHRHTWETAIRGCAPNATLDDYFVEVLDTFAPVYRPRTSVPATSPGPWSASTPGSPHWSTGRTSTTRPITPMRPSPRCRRPASERSTPTAAPTSRWPTTGSTARSRFRATTYDGSGRRTSAPTTVCSPWAWPPAARASARRRSFGRSGSWRASWASRSPCTSRWAGSPDGSR